MGNSVGDRGGSGDGHRFSNANDTSLRHILKNHVDFRYVSGTGQLVGLKVWIEDYSCLSIQNSFFVQSEADAHDDPSVDLAYAGEPINNQTAILHTNNPFYPDESGFGVHFHFRHLHAADAAARESLFPAATSHYRIYSQAGSCGTPIRSR